MSKANPRLTRVVRDVSHNCLGLRARLVERVVSGVFDRHLRPLGLRITQVTLLTAIARAGEVTPSALGRMLALEKSTVSRTIDRMIDRGWVETIEVDDARSYAVRLTDDGEQTLLEAHPAWRTAQKELEETLGDSAGDLQTLAACLNDAFEAPTAAARGVKPSRRE